MCATSEEKLSIIRIYTLGIDLFSQLTGTGSRNEQDPESPTTALQGNNRKRKANAGNEGNRPHLKEDMITRPVCCVEARMEAEILWVGFSDVLFSIDGRVELRGYSAGSKGAQSLPLHTGAKIVSGFGTEDILGVTDSHGKIWTIDHDNHMLQIRPQHELSAAFGNSVQQVQILGNDCVAVLHSYGAAVSTFESLSTFLSYSSKRDGPGPVTVKFRHSRKLSFVALRGAESHFVALDSVGNVWTWGTPNLHGELLQRPQSHLELLRPQIVPALEGIQMRAISTGGWITAALSVETRDVYIWGWLPNGAHIVGMPMQSEVAGLIDQFDENEELQIESVGVGNGFVVIATSNSLTHELAVWVAGGSNVYDVFGERPTENFVKIDRGNKAWGGPKSSELYDIEVTCGPGCIFVTLVQKS
ncbi:hypothetical protein V1512DRAFT_258763 [Lipomyces arxii]|uniref:uncharacterized protein n=1 Tax=Lipomyces arxii TaxID=56418 RepID=UPI0034CD0F95